MINYEIPKTLDQATRGELEHALRFAQEHPWLFAAKPVGNFLLAAGLAVFSVVHLLTAFAIVFG